MKPVINLSELTLESVEAEGPFEQSYGVIGARIGAQKLGYNLTIVPPGKRACPFHNHHINEEMFFMLEGQGLLRFGDKEYALRPFDAIACPAGSSKLAHQIINTGTVALKYLALSTMERAEICQYPDSDKLGVTVGTWDKSELRAMFKAGSSVDYNEGEV